MSEATSVGAIKLDVEVEAKLNEDIKKAASEMADKIQKQVSGMSSDIFKDLRKAMVQSLEKTQEAIKGSFDAIKAEMRAFIEQISAIINHLNDIQFSSSDGATKNNKGQQKSIANSIRGPPNLKVQSNKIDLSSNANVIKAQQLDLANQILITTNLIKIQKDELAELEEKSAVYNGWIDKFNESAKRTDIIADNISKLNISLKTSETMGKKLEITNEINRLKKELDATTFKMDSLKSKMFDISGDDGKGLLNLEKNILKIKSAISANELKLTQMKEASLQATSKSTSGFKLFGNSISGLKGKIAGLSLSVAQKGLSALRTGFLRAGNAVQNFMKKASSAALTKLGNGLTSLGNKATDLAKRFLGLGSASDRSSKKMNGFNLGRLIKSFTIFSLIFPLVSRGIMALGQNISQTLMTNEQFSNSLTQIRSNLATAFTPIYNAIMPALNALMSGLAKLTGYLSAFISALFGQTYSATKKATQGIYAAKDAMGVYGNSASKAAEEAEKAKKSLMGFDEINKLDDPSSTSGGGSGGSSAPEYNPTDVNESLVNRWVKKLKDMWSKGDYAGIGKLIGQKVNEAVQSFTKFISWNNLGSKITEFINGFCELFNSLIATIDWLSIGNMFGEGINTIANTLYLLLNGINWQRIGSALANGLNGIVYTVDWNKLGQTIGSFFQAKINGLYGFVVSADWKSIGKALADGVTGVGSSIDWIKLVTSLITGINGVISSIRTFITNIKWSDIGATIMEMIRVTIVTFDWSGLGSALYELATALINMLRGAVENTNWGELGRALFTGLLNAITSINWLDLAFNIATLLAEALAAINSFIRGAAKGIAESLWNGLTSGIQEFFSNPIGFLKKNIVDPIVNGVKSLFGIHSPSTVFAEIGRYLIEGLKNGMKNLIPDLISNVGEWFGNIGETIYDTWDNVKSWTSDKWNGIKDFCSDTWNKITGNTKSKTTEIKNQISSSWTESSSKTRESLSKTRSNVSSSFRTMSSTVSSQCNEIKNTTSKKFSEVNKNVASLKTPMNKNAKEAFNSYNSGAKSIDVQGVVRSIMNKVKSTISNTISQGYTWGSDMMSGLASGIRNATSWVTNAVSNVANTISSWLHFSRPDVGPLHYYEEWMPDFMHGLSSTLESSSPNFIKRVRTVADQISNAMQMSLSEPTLAFAGGRELTVSHEFTEKKDNKETTLDNVIEAIEEMKDEITKVKKSIDDKDTSVNIDKKALKDTVVEEVNKDTRRTGKCPIDF